MNFPGGSVVKNLPSSVRNTGSIPSQGTKIPHAARQLSSRTAASEPVCRNAGPPLLQHRSQRSCVLHLRSDTAKNK